MRKTSIYLLLLLFTLAIHIPVVHAQAKEKHVKSVIMLIPDGTSTSVLALTRWYKFGICPNDACWLNIDPYIVGLVKTHSSDAPIGDSAPTGSTYATGYLSQTQFIATYPRSNPGKDLVKIDPSKAYQPLMTILEAAKLNHKSTGLVVTCQFPHATPADFCAHTPHRDAYDVIAKQMVYNHLNVVFAGGTKYLNSQTRSDKEDLVSVLKERKYNYVTNYHDFKKISATDSLVWGLFAKDYLPFDLDTNKDSIPSLAEMTDKALQILSKNENGFFIMIEGSKVDWAAHNNDPVGVVSEFVAFDDAVKVAIDFAKKDGNTAVVICPDHGNSAITVGSQRSSHGYDTLSVKSIIQPLRNCKLTAEGLADKLLSQSKEENIIRIFKDNTQIELKTPEVDSLTILIKTNKKHLLVRKIAKIVTNHTYIGFTTTGHTSEDVMLGNYHPHDYRLSGVVQNTGINTYMRDVLGINNLEELTDRYYCIDTVALKGFHWNITSREFTFRSEEGGIDSTLYATLLIKKNGSAKKRIEIKSYTDYASVYDGKKELKRLSLGSVAVFIDERDRKKHKPRFQHFYIPREIGEMMAKELK